MISCLYLSIFSTCAQIEVENLMPLVTLTDESLEMEAAAEGDQDDQE
jgi:hypothetical protein